MASSANVLSPSCRRRFDANRRRGIYSDNGGGCGGGGFRRRGRGIFHTNRQGWLEDKKCQTTNTRDGPTVKKLAIDLTLSDDDDDGVDKGGHHLRVNENYADRYDRWRRMEEAEKIKARYGERNDDDKEDEEDSSSSEDEEGDRLPPEFDKEFLRALSCLKGKDPRIYDGQTQFFEKLDITNVKDAHSNKSSKPRKIEKPIFLKDYERQMLLTNEEGLPDETKDNEKLKKELQVEKGTYMEEQQRIKESFKQLVADSDSDDDLLTERKKTVTETRKDDDNYYSWLKGQKQHLDEEADEKEIGYLKAIWKKDSLPVDEKFLRDFIMDKKYLDQDKTGKSTCSFDAGFNVESSAEEEVIDKMDQFENKFNFRFEEPDKEFIKRYPRLVTNSLRAKGEKRKVQRDKTREKNNKKKDQKREELKRLKAMKRKEITEKLEKIKQITGNAKVGLEAGDLDGDFDPEVYDQRMRQVFDDEYYDCDVPDANDEEKPEFPLDEDYENWDEWKWGGDKTEQEGNNYETHCEDPDFNMDCEYNPKVDFQQEMVNASRKKRRKLSKLAKALQRKKPVFDPKDKTFEEYFDEYYKLDYEDIIDDLPCRFKYRKVLENDFGLTVDEILSAEDRELNAWCSLKKTCQYRSEQEEIRDLDAYRQKSRSFWKKEKILKSVYSTKDDHTVDTVILKATDEVSKSSKKQKLQTNRNEKNKRNSIDQVKVCKRVRLQRKKKKDFNERTGNKRKSVDVGISDSRLKAFGLNPKKFKNKLIYGTADHK